MNGERTTNRWRWREGVRAIAERMRCIRPLITMMMYMATDGDEVHSAID